MTDMIKYLEGLKARKGIKSDRQLAGMIGISQGSITNIMTGLSVPKDETCTRL